MAVGVCSSVSFSAKKFLRGVSSNMERGPAYSYLVPIDVDHPQAARGNDEQAADEAMMPPCHTGEEAYGKKDDVLLVVQKEGKDRFHCGLLCSFSRTQILASKSRNTSSMRSTLRSISSRRRRPSRRRAAEVDEGHRADGGREFLFFVADVPNADYLAGCVLDRLITGHVRFAEDVDFAVESLTFVDIHYRVSLRVQDSPKRPALYAARHIGGYADIIITRLYEKRSRAAGLSLDLVDNCEVVVHLG